MAAYDKDLYKKILSQANKSKLLQSTVNQAIIGQNSRMNSKTIGKPLAVFDTAADHIWAHDAKRSKSPNSYFDYYYTGQDIKIYIDGTNDEAPLQSSVPIMQFAFKVTQQKSPLYGYASYAYDTMMRGTRIVNGVFRIATTTTSYMTDLIAEATESRLQGEYLFPIRNLDEDEENIERFWQKTIDPSKMQAKNLWSSHPPFNFIIVYGIQSSSLYDTPITNRNDAFQQYIDGDSPMYVDINERLTEADPSSNTMRRIIENVELMDLQVEYGPDGQICSELYSFVARDVYYPPEINRNTTPTSNVANTVQETFFGGSPAQEESEPPIILSINPDYVFVMGSGPYGTITLTGLNFSTVTSVTVDGDAALFEIVNDTTITYTDVSVGFGVFTVEVTNPDGSYSIPWIKEENLPM